MSHVRSERFHSRTFQHALRSLSLAALVLVLPTACASTAAAPRTEVERHLYRLLGKPGPQTKLDYVTVVGTRGLILDHHLPEDVAKRYIDAFSSSP